MLLRVNGEIYQAVTADQLSSRDLLQLEAQTTADPDTPTINLGVLEDWTNEANALKGATKAETEKLRKQSPHAQLLGVLMVWCALRNGGLKITWAECLDMGMSEVVMIPEDDDTEEVQSAVDPTRRPAPPKASGRAAPGAAKRARSSAPAKSSASTSAPATSTPRKSGRR